MRTLTSKLALSLTLVLAAACGGGHNGAGGGADGGGGDGGGGDGPSTGPCTDGQTQCGANMDVQTCSGGTWTSTEVCPLGCSAGACASSSTCTAGARACFGNVVGVCNATGTGWLFDASCADTCSGGSCTGGCTAGATRCNSGAVEQCAADGSSWTQTQTCSHGCDAGQCVLDRIDVTSDTTLDGVVIVAGPVNVFAGATLHSPSGNLEIHAQSITVDAGGTIAVDAAGQGTAGAGGQGGSCYSQGVSSWTSGGGGAHATPGYDGEEVGYTCAGFGGDPFGSGLDLSWAMGGPGGPGQGQTARPNGGGSLRLYAPTITVAGTLRADGSGGNGQSGSSGSGGGAGGTILVAADQLSLTGAVSALGGNHATYGQGGDGFVKLLYGSSHTITATISGQATQSLVPPLALGSVTEPEQTLFYNDGFDQLALSWSAPFPARQGYYWTQNTTAVAPPTAGTGTFVQGEAFAVTRDNLVQGDNYVHLVSIDSASAVGTLEATFHLHLETQPPALSSASHPSQTEWSTSHDPLIAWAFRHPDPSYTGVYYVLDHYGDTVPATTDTFIPASQKQLLRAGLADGIWAFHVIAVDRAGHLTRAAASYQVRLGADPGLGRALGQVSGPSGGVASATVRFNRGLLADQTTNSTGTYDLATVPAGTWEVTASAPGLKSQTKTITVAVGGQVQTDFTLTP